MKLCKDCRYYTWEDLGYLCYRYHCNHPSNFKLENHVHGGYERIKECRDKNPKGKCKHFEELKVIRKRLFGLIQDTNFMSIGEAIEMKESKK